MKMRTITATTAAIASLTLAGFTSPAFADTQEDARLTEFVEALDPSAEAEEAFQAAFDELPASEQEAFLDAASLDPFSVLEITPVPDPEVAEDDTQYGTGISLLATTRAYVAEQKANVTVLGVVTGSYNLRYRFEANGTSVTRNLECKAWWTGFSGFTNISSSAKSWLSGGKGYCVGTHKMNIVYKGSGVSGVKEQGISYSGKPTLLSNYIKNL